MENGTDGSERKEVMVERDDSGGEKEWEMVI